MCGKCVCEECSKIRRRLCKKDKNAYRVCEYCDSKIENRKTEEMFREILDRKDNIIQKYRHDIADLEKREETRKKRIEELTEKVLAQFYLPR